MHGFDREGGGGEGGFDSESSCRAGDGGYDMEGGSIEDGDRAWAICLY